MAETSYPWDGQVAGDATTAPYSAEEWADVQRTLAGIAPQRNDAGIILGSGAETTALEGLQVTQNSPVGTSVLVNIGRALVDGKGYKNTGAITIAIAANASGNPRIDTIVLRKSVAAQTVRAVVLQGTPGASPNPPNLTQSAGVTWEIPLADIAVANGFVSITNANITPRAIGNSLGDGVYLDRVLNNTGAVNQTGDAVIVDTSADRAAAKSALANHNLPLGAWLGRTAAAGYGRVLNRGIGYVRTTAAVARGDYVGTSTTPGSLLGTGTQRLVNSVALMLESTSGAGLGLAYVDAGLKPNYGKLVVNGGTSLNALTIDNIPQFYPVYVIEIRGVSQIVGVSETINIRFGSAGGGNLDLTAANYYSFLSFISNSTPVLGSLQNLGATAGWQINVPGSTSTNSSFYFVMQIKGVNAAANLKEGIGHGWIKTANTNGALSVTTFGGLWSNATKALEQISIVTVGGNNMSMSVSVYGKDGVTN